MIRFFAFLFIFCSTSAFAETTELYRCTSDSEKIESLTVTYVVTNVHGEDSTTHELIVLDSQMERKDYWIDNAPTTTNKSFSARFRDFNTTIEVLVNFPPKNKKVTQPSEVIWNGEKIPTWCVKLPSDIM